MVLVHGGFVHARPTTGRAGDLVADRAEIGSAYAELVDPVVQRPRLTTRLVMMLTSASIRESVSFSWVKFRRDG